MTMQIPAYLTDPALALAERAQWEIYFEDEVRVVLAGTEGLRDPSQSLEIALTASLFPTVAWSSAVAGLTRRLRLPPMVQRSLLSSERMQRLLADKETAAVATAVARAAATGSFNLHVLSQLASYRLGYKMWLSKRDDRVRSTHEEMDGVIVPLSSPFNVNGSLMQHPGDSRTSSIEEWAGCRCAVVGRRRA